MKWKTTLNFFFFLLNWQLFQWVYYYKFQLVKKNLEYSIFAFCLTQRSFERESQVFNMHRILCTSWMNEKFNWPVVGCRCICRVKYANSVASTFIPLEKWSSLKLWPPQRPTNEKKNDIKSNNNTNEIIQKTVAMFVWCSIAALAAHVKHVYKEYITMAYDKFCWITYFFLSILFIILGEKLIFSYSAIPFENYKFDSCW